MPTIIPEIIISHTIAIHIPTPNTNAAMTPKTIVPTVLPFTLIAGLPSILRLTISSTASTTIPAAAMTTQGVKAFHSGKRHIHMPTANKIPPIVPRIKLIKFFFVITDNLRFVFHLLAI